MKDFSLLIKNLKKDFTGFTRIKVVILSNTAIQLFAQAIRGWGYELTFDIQLFISDFDQIDRQIMDSSSELYQYNPEITFIFESSYRLFK